MATALARQIEARMKAKNISILTLEREAGLKGHGVRNIVRGKSKKPSAESLQAISDILGCTVKDLLGFKELFDDTNLPTRESILSLPYKQTPLLSEVMAFVTTNWNKGGENGDKTLTTHQLLTCINEIYTHSRQRSTDHMDQNFAQWYLSILEM